MATVSNPFVGLTDKKIKNEDLAHIIRLNIIGELDAIQQYDAHIKACNDPYVVKVLTSIKDEEVVHCGELQHLLEYLAPETTELIEKGRNEAANEKNSNETRSPLDESNDFIDDDVDAIFIEDI